MDKRVFAAHRNTPGPVASVATCDDAQSKQDSTCWDLIVIGSGMAGIVCARDVCQAGFKVLLLDARDRLGGRTWTASFPGSSTDVDLGAEWMDPVKHKKLAAECARQGVATVSADLQSGWSFRGDSDGPKAAGVATASSKERLSFAHAFQVLNADVAACAASLHRGSHMQDTTLDLDLPWAEYVSTRLQATGRVEDYLLAQGFNVAGAHETEYSASLVIHDLAMYIATTIDADEVIAASTTITNRANKGFSRNDLSKKCCRSFREHNSGYRRKNRGTAHTGAAGAVSDFGDSLGPDSSDPFENLDMNYAARRVEGGFGGLAELIAAEFTRLGGTVELATPVVAVESKFSCKASNQGQKYRFCNSEHVRSSTGCCNDEEGTKWIEVETSSLTSKDVGSRQRLYRANAVVVAVPINLLGSIRFSPALDPALAAAVVNTSPTQLCLSPTHEPSRTVFTNAGSCAKVWLRARRPCGRENVSTCIHHSEQVAGVDQNVKPSFNHVMGLPSLCAESYTMPWNQVHDTANERRYQRQPHQRQQKKVQEPCPNSSSGDCSSVVNGGKGNGELFAMLRCAQVLPTRDEAETLLRTHQPGTTVLQEPFGHDWLADPWSRGSWMAVRNGKADIVRRAASVAPQPWAYLDVNEEKDSDESVVNGGPSLLAPAPFLAVIGGDISPRWVGYMEGAVETAVASAASAIHFLTEVRKFRVPSPNLATEKSILDNRGRARLE